MNSTKVALPGLKRESLPPFTYFFQKSVLYPLISIGQIYILLINLNHVHSHIISDSLMVHAHGFHRLITDPESLYPQFAKNELVLRPLPPR